MTDTSNDAVASMCLAMINSGNTTTANMLTALAVERDAANARADQARDAALVEAARYLEEAAWGYGSTFESSFHSTVHDKLSDVLIPFVLTESDLAAIKEPKP